MWLTCVQCIMSPTGNVELEKTNFTVIGCGMCPLVAEVDDEMSSLSFVNLEILGEAKLLTNNRQDGHNSSRRSTPRHEETWES